MRVCPKCSHVDPAYWKHCKFSYYIDACTFENFQIMHPLLAKKLKKSGDEIDDVHYIYRRTKVNNIMRKAKVDFVAGLKWRDGTEKVPSHSSPWNVDNPKLRPHLWKYIPSQTKLFEENP